MEAFKEIVLIAIAMVVVFDKQSVSTPTNDRWFREKLTPKVNEHDLSQKTKFGNEKYKFSEQFEQLNEPLNGQNSVIARESKRKRHNMHEESWLSPLNFYRSDESRLNNIESYNADHTVKIRKRQNIPLDDGSGQGDSEDDDTGSGNSQTTNYATPTLGGMLFFQHKQIVRKCCPPGEAFLHPGTSCTRSSVTQLKRFQTKSAALKLQLMYAGHSPCAYGGHRLLSNIHSEKYTLYPNGSIKFQNRELGPDQFCFEAFLDNEELLPVVCYQDDSYNSAEYFHIIVGKIITVPFLLIVLIVYILISELRNTFGITVMCHAATLLFSYIVFFAVEGVYSYVSLNSCRSYAFVIYITFQSSFFWLNVMCYDLCWSLCMMKTLDKKRKLIIYSCYAWGVPLILMLIYLHKDIVPGIPGYYLKPEYGHGGCLYTAQLDHFYMPVVVLQLCNLTIFAGTFFKMLCHNRHAALTGEERYIRKNKHLHDMYILYCKFFMVKGIVSVTLLIMWILDVKVIMWYLINLQAIFICISLVCNENTLNLIRIWGRYWSHNCCCSFRHKSEYGNGKQKGKPNSPAVIHNDLKNNTNDVEMKTFKTNTKKNEAGNLH